MDISLVQNYEAKLVSSEIFETLGLVFGQLSVSQMIYFSIGYNCIV